MGWYKTGTIAISGVTVTGTGTNWTDNKQGIGPGQALLIPAAGTVKMYEILRVDSATKLTLTSDAGTVSAGQAYAIMSFYSDSVPDFARRLSAQLSYYQTQMDGWQQIMTGTGSINLTAPDGTTVTISSFKKLTDDMSNKADLNGGAVAIAQGGTGAKTAAAARTNLGLGTAALIDANTGVAGVSGWFRDTATGWTTQKGRLTVAANTSVAVTLPISFTTVGTCVVVCTINSSGTSFSSTGDLLGTMDSAGVVRISNTHSTSLSINYIIIGW